MGSKSKVCDLVAREISEWAIGTNNWLTVSHIAGVENVCADRQSRRKHKQEIEWGLSQECVDWLMKKLKCMPQVDLFAISLKYKLKFFYSWRRDPEVEGRDD